MTRMTHPQVDTNWLAIAAEDCPRAVALIEDDGTKVLYKELSAMADEVVAELSSPNQPGIGEIVVVPVGKVDAKLVARLWGSWRYGIAPLVVDKKSPLVKQSPAAIADMWDTTAHVGSAGADLVHTVVLTSGSAGKPRPVRLTHRNVAAAVSASQQRLGNTSADKWLLAMPLFHVGGLSILWRSAAAKGTVVVHNKFDAVRVVQAVKNGAVTMASFVPTMLYRILETDPGPYEGMKAVLIGGAAANRELVERGLDAGLPICQTYGMTETTSQIATVTPGQAVEALGTVGQPLPGLSVKTGGAGVGEIVVSGDAVSPGYLGERDREGGHRTGDIGYLDDKGRLVVLGRADDMAITGGENVYPTAVADTLSRHKSINEIEVLGVPDPEWGQVLVAVVVGDPQRTEKIEEWAQKRLPRHEIPKRWVFVDEIPVQPGGKIDRVALATIARNAR